MLIFKDSNGVLGVLANEQIPKTLKFEDDISPLFSETDPLEFISSKFWQRVLLPCASHQADTHF